MADQVTEVHKYDFALRTLRGHGFDVDSTNDDYLKISTSEGGPLEPVVLLHNIDQLLGFIAGVVYEREKGNEL